MFSPSRVSSNLKVILYAVAKTTRNAVTQLLIIEHKRDSWAAKP